MTQVTHLSSSSVHFCSPAVCHINPAFPLPGGTEWSSHFFSSVSSKQLILLSYPPLLLCFPPFSKAWKRAPTSLACPELKQGLQNSKILHCFPNFLSACQPEGFQVLKEGRGELIYAKLQISPESGGTSRHFASCSQPSTELAPLGASRTKTKRNQIQINSALSVHMWKTGTQMLFKGRKVGRAALLDERLLRGPGENSDWQDSARFWEGRQLKWLGS